MATTSEVEYPFEAVTWDYDAAPDALEYGVWKRRRFRTLEEAQSFIEYQTDEPCFAVGGAVYVDGKRVYGLGLVLGYPTKKPDPNP